MTYEYTAPSDVVILMQSLSSRSRMCEFNSTLPTPPPMRMISMFSSLPDKTDSTISAKESTRSSTNVHSFFFNSSMMSGISRLSPCGPFGVLFCHWPTSDFLSSSFPSRLALSSRLRSDAYMTLLISSNPLSTLFARTKCFDSRRFILTS
jgi:hypothetical protein